MDLDDILGPAEPSVDSKKKKKSSSSSGKEKVKKDKAKKHKSDNDDSDDEAVGSANNQSKGKSYEAVNEERPALEKQYLADDVSEDHSPRLHSPQDAENPRQTLIYAAPKEVAFEPEDEDDGPFSAVAVVKACEKRVKDILRLTPSMPTSLMLSEKLLETTKEQLAAAENREKLLSEHFVQMKSEMAEMSAQRLRDTAAVQAAQLAEKKNEVLSTWASRISPVAALAARGSPDLDALRRIESDLLEAYGPVLSQLTEREKVSALVQTFD
jgi:hypothetical protein